MTKIINFSQFLETKPKIFFLGIGGVSMSSLAFTAKKIGCDVSGYDCSRSETVEKLEQAGIRVYSSFDEKHFENVDLVVYTGAIRENDIELSYPRSIGIPTLPRSRFLGHLMQKSKNPIGVAGTHGKSTTTGMLTSIFLKDKARDPIVMAGAALPEIGGNYRLGSGEDFIFEACEYQNSFLDFHPHIAVILNAEHDHADFFPTLQDVLDSFVKFADLAKAGFAVVNADNEGAKWVAERTSSPVFSFSAEKKADLWCENLSEKNGFFSFDIQTKAGDLCSVSLSVPGAHNVSNALAAASAAYLSDVSAEAIRAGLQSFRGVKRRFEYRGTCGKMQVFDDYAHHPDEIRATLLSAQKMGFPKITVVFQPHTFSRTKAYWKGFVSSLSLADQVILADIYPAREEALPGIDCETLARESDRFLYLGDMDKIAEHLLSSKEEGLLLIMGAGDVVSLTDRILTDKFTS